MYFAIAALIISAISTAYSYSQQKQAARQAQQEGEAYSKGLKQQSVRLMQENAEKALRERKLKRFRMAEVESKLHKSGVDIAGSTLEALAEEEVRLETVMQDVHMQGAENVNDLLYRSNIAKYQGAAQASLYKAQSTGTLLSGAASISSSIYDINKQTKKPTAP